MQRLVIANAFRLVRRGTTKERIGVSAYRRIGVSACRRVGVSAPRRGKGAKPRVCLSV